MEQSSEFIVSRLREWTSEHADLRVEYGVDNFKREHEIRIDRTATYGSEDFQKELLSLWSEFSKSFPGETIVITPPPVPDERTRKVPPMKAKVVFTNKKKKK